ncbi:hypothetical protein QJS04_geneDACA004199 [Acorus gramineus]|uniref:Uncharacterized protein n=1 Tax=Acorus gramineus TaxID=55184 RepID=A0AAV9B257_ACOGR|nr:hypothetical protein QJS04_geneDACA004199 [Acorus gramineus]
MSISLRLNLKILKEQIVHTLLGYSYSSRLLPPAFLRGDATGPGLALVFLSSRALLNITVNPSAEAGLFTSHSPNLGNGRPLSCCYSQKKKKKLTHNLQFNIQIILR